MSSSASPDPLRGYLHQGTASLVFKVLFWIHQIVLGLPSVSIGLDLVIEGKAEALFNAIGLLLAWIGGTLVWGIAALIHGRRTFDLPPIFSAIAQNIAQIETMQLHTTAVSAVADAVAPQTNPPSP